MASGVNFSFYQGETFTTLLTVKDSNGNTINLTNYSGYSPAFYRYGSCEPDFQFYVNVYDPINGLLQLTAYGATTTGVPAGRLNYQTRLYSPYNTTFISHAGYLDLLPGDISYGGNGGGADSPSGDYTFNQYVNANTGVYYQAIIWPSPFNSIPCVFTQLNLPTNSGDSWYFIGTSGVSETGMYITYGTQILETGYRVNVLAQICSDF